jgi:hypothetical protein
VPVPSESNPAAAPTATTPSAPVPSNTQLFQPGKELVIHVDAVTLPNSTAPAPAVSGNQVNATVIGNGSNGQLILKTTDATLYVKANVEAPIGTNLLIRVEPPKAQIPTVLHPVDSQNFATLQQTLDAVAQINPQAAQQIINSRVPQPNEQLAGPLLFFLSALKRGDAKGWLGSDAAEALTRGGKLDLLNKLGQYMGNSVQTEHDPAVGEWKSYPIPLHQFGQFQTMTLHVHEDGGREASTKSSRATDQIRFVIDVNMSRFGPMQLDGLVRPKKLDMIVRSEVILPPGMPQELRTSYLTTIEALGYTGSLSFQTGRQHWITPRKTTPQIESSL